MTNDVNLSRNKEFLRTQDFLFQTIRESWAEGAGYVIRVPVFLALRWAAVFITKGHFVRCQPFSLGFFWTEFQ